MLEEKNCSILLIRTLRCFCSYERQITFIMKVASRDVEPEPEPEALHVFFLTRDSELELEYFTERTPP